MLSTTLLLSGCVTSPKLPPPPTTRAAAHADFATYPNKAGRIIQKGENEVASYWTNSNFHIGKAHFYAVFFQVDRNATNHPHVQAAHINVVTYRYNTRLHAWKLDSILNNIARVGSFGMAPSVKVLKPIATTKDSATFGFDDGSTNQGETDIWKDILIYFKNAKGARRAGFFYLGGIRISGDNKGSGLPPYYSYKGKLSVGKRLTAGGFPRLRVSYTGTATTLSYTGITSARSTVTCIASAGKRKRTYRYKCSPAPFVFG